MPYSNQSDDTALTNEMLDLLCDKPPEKLGLLTSRGFQLPYDKVGTIWLSICNDLSFGVEMEKDLIPLGDSLNTLGKLRELCHVLNIKLDELRLVPGYSR